MAKPECSNGNTSAWKDREIGSLKRANTVSDI